MSEPKLLGVGPGEPHGDWSAGEPHGDWSIGPLSAQPAEPSAGEPVDGDP